MKATSPIRTETAPYSAEQIAQYVEDFERDGYCLIPDVLDQDEITALKAGADRIFEEEQFVESHNRYGEIVGVRLFETDRIFEEMLTREPIIGLVESILGEDCHLIAQNIVRNEPGQAIDTFHADDTVIFPTPPGVARHPANYKMPIFLLTVQIPLTDIETIEYGPTEFVPGSHYSGRNPDDAKNPDFEGQKAVPILCKAGDIYLHNGQCWHRGAPNNSDRTRYLLQQAYSQRFISQRFYPFLNYTMPEHVIQNADERRLRVLGAHPKGAYG